MSTTLIVTMLATLVPAAALAEAVDITISGTRATGKVFGQVFSDAATFKSRERPVLKFAVEPRGGADIRTTITLPPGRYAIAMFQDTKATGKMETNMFGAPVVPYGFSNNARGTLGPPGFDTAAFDVSATAVKLSIQLR